MIQTKDRAKPFDFFGGLPGIDAFSCPGHAFGWDFPAYFQEIGIDQILDGAPVPLACHAPPLDDRVSRCSARLRDLAPDRTAILKNITDLDLRLLRVLACMTGCGGFTAAQAELNMSQSNISMHIASLERRLGYRLRERGKGGFRLTAKGRRMLEVSRTMFDTIGLFRNQTQTLSGRLVGELYLDLMDNLATPPQTRFGDTLVYFQRCDQDVQPSLFVNSSTGLEPAVIKDELDLMISYLNRSRPSLEYRPLYHEETDVFCGDCHPLLAKVQPTLERIVACDWVMHGFLPENLVLPLRPSCSRATAHRMEAVAHAMLAGTRLSYLPTYYAETWIGRGRMRVLLPEWLSYPVEHSMIIYAGRPLSEATRTFVDDLLQVHGLRA